MSTPYIGYGFIVSVNDGSSQAQQVFADVQDVNIPFGDVELLPFSTMSQTTKDMQCVPAMIKPSKVKIKMLYGSTDYARLVALKGLRYITGTTKPTWVITTTDSTPKVHTFVGYLETVETDAKTEAIVEMTATVGVSGPITIT